MLSGSVPRIDVLQEPLTGRGDVVFERCGIKDRKFKGAVSREQECWSASVHRKMTRFLTDLGEVRE